MDFEPRDEITGGRVTYLFRYLCHAEFAFFKKLFRRPPFQVCPADRPGEQRVSRKRLKTEYSPPKGVILSDLIANFVAMIMLEVILTFFCSHH